MKTKAKLKQGTVFGRETERGITLVALIITIISFVATYTALGYVKYFL